MFTKPANLKPTANSALGTPASHRPRTARARPALRRTALVIAGTGAVAAMALGPSAPSFADTIPIVTTVNQAGYQVGNNAWNFRYVQAVVTLPPSSSPPFGCVAGRPNYLESSLQLISTATGQNAAIGVSCDSIALLGNQYRLRWALDYSGNRHPNLNQLDHLLHPGDRILMWLYYDPIDADHTVQFRACYAVGEPAQCRNHELLLNKTRHINRRFFKQAVLSANVANPMPHPPAAGTTENLMGFGDAYVTAYNGHPGIGIDGPWHVQQENESPCVSCGNLVAAPTPLATFFPPDHQRVSSRFGITLFGNPPIGP